MNKTSIKNLHTQLSSLNSSLWSDIPEIAQADYCGGSGLATGKRQHRPILIIKPVESVESSDSSVASTYGIRSIPTLM